MSTKKQMKESRYSIRIFQGRKNKKWVILHLCENGKPMKAPKHHKFEYTILGGRGKSVARILFQLIQYARFNGKDFKEAWESDETWFD